MQTLTTAERIKAILRNTAAKVQHEINRVKREYPKLLGESDVDRR